MNLDKPAHWYKFIWMHIYKLLLCCHVYVWFLGMPSFWFYVIGGCSLFTVIVVMFTTCCVILYCKQQKQAPIIDKLVSKILSSTG